MVFAFVFLAAVLVGAGLAGPARGAPITKGSSIFALQLARGDGDFAEVLPGPVMRASAHPDLGAQAQFWHFFDEDYAFNASGGLGFSKETDKDAAGADERRYTQSTWHVRLGGDRVAHLTDRFHFFAGPGVELWRGKAKTEQAVPGGGTVVTETPWATRAAISGRFAVHLKMGSGFGLMGQIGQYFGWAHATDDATGVEATWWPSGTEGGAGVAFNF